MSKVYWTNMHTKDGDNLLDKLERVIKIAGIESIDFNKKFVAIKLHFGELGNLSFLRPNFSKRVADVVKASGGMPFLTDCNTLYVGSRKHALEHLSCAAENGFSMQSTGCHVIIGDGLKGTDEVEVPLENTKIVKNAKIGRAIMDADIVISLNHFKGHEFTGFGGAIKNLGMGCASRAGKMEQHCSGKLSINEKLCKKCKKCAKICGADAISFNAEGIARISENKCVGCGRCLGMCNFDAIFNPNFIGADKELSIKMAEYTLAVVQNRPQFHINIVNQVSPYCDCHGQNDIPIIPDVGIFASFDAVSVDKACADACNKAPVMNGSLLEKNLESGCKNHHDHFTNTAPITDWKIALEECERLGIGEMNYELIEIK